MSEQYDRYLIGHVANVRKGYLWMKENIPQVLNSLLSPSMERDLSYNIENHDKSKSSDDEYDAYDKYFYGGNRSYGVKTAFNYAWLHHIHNNPHHWQHWVLIHDDPDEDIEVLDMPVHYIIEMICDWWAFSWAKGDLKEVFNWYDSHKDYIKLSRVTKATVEYILSEISKVLEEEK